ncbi:MAG: diguanylate cyclase [Rhodanobacter sp.]|jgi:diguanylate cyclase (GGDEF)-like protein|nr:diguanylate cyclase [Rhodanobacter sp.]
MSNLTLPQLQATVVQLDQALYVHEQWLRDLMRALVVKTPPEPSDLLPDAHRRCRFGLWYGGDATVPLREHPAFKAIGQAHEKMHRSATQLLQQTADALPIAAAEMDQLIHALDRLRLEINSLRRELAEQAENRDPLTGARNRTHLLSDLREQQALVRREMQQCVLAMIDLDHFKAVNDHYGHTAGDAVLSGVVQCLAVMLRPYDHLYRYGGEEFLLCMPNTGIEAAIGLAERLRAAIAALQIPYAGKGSPLSITASFGITLLDALNTVEVAIDHADRALYLAKSAGRDRIEIWVA